MCQRWQINVFLLNSRILRITFIFVTGPTGVKGNQWVDSLAALWQWSRNRADILTALKNHARLENLHLCDAQLMSRMLEKRIKIGTARTNKRWLTNQRRTRTISNHTHWRDGHLSTYGRVSCPLMNIHIATTHVIYCGGSVFTFLELNSLTTGF